MKIYRVFLLVGFITLSSPAGAYNPKDLQWHTDFLVSSLLAGDDLDASFVKTHLNIGCDEKDVQNVKNQGLGLDNIYDSFSKNSIILPLNEEVVIVKFKELNDILKNIYNESEVNPKLQAACIIVEKEISRSLFSLCCISLKGEKKELELEEAKNQFLKNLNSKEEVITNKNESSIEVAVLQKIDINAMGISEKDAQKVIYTTKNLSAMQLFPLIKKQQPLSIEELAKIYDIPVNILSEQFKSYLKQEF